METPATKRGVPVGWHLAALAVGAALPGLIFTAVVARRLVEAEREALDRRVIERARGLSRDLDIEMSATFRALQALAESEYLDGASPDLAAFRRRISRVCATQPSWRAVVLFRPDGTALVHTSLPDPHPQQDVHDRASFEQLARTLRPTVGNLVASRSSGQWGFPLRVPVVRDGRLKYVISAVITPATALAVLANEPRSEEWTRSVVDGANVVVARTRGHEQFMGRPSTSGFVERLSTLPGGHGALFPSITIEGASGYAAVHRSALSGWVTCVVLPAAAVEGPVQRSIAMLAGSALVLLVLGGGGALLLARRLSRAFAAAVDGADALAEGRTPRAPPSSVREFMALHGALARSAGLLAAREAERDQHLAQAEAARAEAEAATRVKDEFLAMLGHELRNPLAPMRTALELLRLRGQPGGRELEVLERQMRHLGRLVDDLLDVSRITRGQLVLERRPVSVRDVIEHAVEIASPIIEERRHELVVDVQPAALAALGDPDRLAQVVANLLTNSGKYSPDAGHIRVEARARDAAELELSVRDDGKGIPAELLPRVFDLFVQGPRESDRQEGGLGLGLTIVRSIVQAHDGRIEVESDGLGKGATFRITLPRATLPPAAATPPPQPARTAAPAPIRVLVVDDNVDAGEMLVELLRDEGHVSELAVDGPTALEVARRFHPDVAILDIGLPVMNGYELAGRLRALEGVKPFPLVALTGYGQQQDIERAAAAGFQRHFVKPPDLTALLAAVRALGSASSTPVG